MKATFPETLMTCVPDALWAGVRDLDHGLTSMPQMINHLKTHWEDPKDILWNGTALSEQERRDTKQWVENLSVGSFTDTAACDGLILVYCQVFRVSVRLQYYRTPIIYVHPRARRTVELAASTSHMAHVRNT